MTSDGADAGQRRSAGGPPRVGAAERTVFPHGSRVCAKVTGDEIVLQGFFQGEALGRRVRVESSGEVDASLTCEVAEVFGHFQGTITAETVHFGPLAIARGTFHATRLTLAEGASVDGSFNVDGVNPSPTASKKDGPPTESLVPALGTTEPVTA